MTDIAELATVESEWEALDRLTENDAVARCVRARRITMKNERAEPDEDESEFEAEQAAKAAFLRAMPRSAVSGMSPVQNVRYVPGPYL
ncbi:MAG: hypothetical protein ABSC62_13795 [Terracidiphilus sp.]|jgi:hypothetical protein